MRLLSLAIAAALLAVSTPASAQWAEFLSKDDGFATNFPNPPKTDVITWEGEYRETFKGRVHSATDGGAKYSVTVVGYRDAEAKHKARVERCRAAKLDGDSCQYDFVVEVAGAVTYASSQILRRPNAKISHYMFYFTEMVGGHLIQLDNADKSRTFAAVHMHDGRLYIFESTVPAGAPDPILFMQSISWILPDGSSVRYRTMYHEGYGEWQFPRPAPARTVRTPEERDAAR